MYRGLYPHLPFQIDRNIAQLEQNATTVQSDIDEMHRRVLGIIRERTDLLKNTVEKYLVAESRSLKDQEGNLKLELANIQVSSQIQIYRVSLVYM